MITVPRMLKEKCCLSQWVCVNAARGPNLVTNKQQTSTYTDKADDKALFPLMNISTSGWMVAVIHIGPLTQTFSYYAQMFVVVICRRQITVFSDR
jgi:hypothetical protein